MEDKVIKWLLYGSVGLSSKAMVKCALGYKKQEKGLVFDWVEPADPSDFNRCLLMLEQIPEVKEYFYDISKISKKWGAIIKNWDKVESPFIGEVGRNWSESLSAAKTYKLMKSIYSEVDK